MVKVFQKILIYSTLIIQVAFIEESQCTYQYLHEHLSQCGSSVSEKNGLLDCVRWDEDGKTSDLLNSMYDTSQETCSSYSVQQFEGFDSCRVQNTFFSMKHDHCTTANDGTQACFIHSPKFTIDKCYPPLTYCAHSVVCPIGSVLYFYNSHMNMTANFPYMYGTDPQHCIDVVEIEYDYQHHSRCGFAHLPTFLSSYGTVLVEFASSQNGQSAGYSMWANCVPIDSSFTQGLNNIAKRALPATIGPPGPPLSLTPIGPPGPPASSGPSGPTGPRGPPIIIRYRNVEVNFSSTVHYAQSRITVYEHKNLKRSFRSVRLLYLYDEQKKLVAKFARTSKKDMYGYGILNIRGNVAYYYQIGVPKEIIPSEEEKLLINHFLTFLNPYFLNHNCTSRSRTGCRLTSLPSKTEQDKVLEEVKGYHTEEPNKANPFVQSAINLVTETIEKFNNNRYQTEHHKTDTKLN